MSRKSGVLELAILGLLHESPLHGYELRKRLNSVLGSFRAFSYGSLYPCLKDLLHRGWIAEEPTVGPTGPGGRRSDRLQAHRRRQGALPGAARRLRAGRLGRRELRRPLRVLRPDRRRRAPAHPRGRRSRLEERVDTLRQSLTRGRERVDSYTLELQRHGLESVEREVRWLNELIDERARDQTGTGNRASDTPGARRPGLKE